MRWSYDSGSAEAVDLLGVGFGPSHLAACVLLSSAIAPSHWARRQVAFLESRPAYAWHPDMLIDGARLQVSFLKDLITAKDPTSPFTFLNYLAERGRLDRFVNLRTFYPTRVEYHDYLSWAAQAVERRVAYGRHVTGIDPVFEPDGTISRLLVAHRDTEGCDGTTIADNVSIAVGGAPSIPGGVDSAALGEMVFHSEEYLRRLDGLRARGARGPCELLVVGAGQSAAEIFCHLAAELPSARVTLAFRGFALMPANSSPMVNEIFDPAAVDFFYDLPEPLRARINTALRHTNYAAVDDDVIISINEMIYEDRLHDRERLSIARCSELVGCRLEHGRPVVRMEDLTTGTTAERGYDAVVLATGYDFSHAEGLIASLDPFFERRADGRLVINRDYSIRADARLTSKVFLMGPTEHSHGLTSTLLSNLPTKAYDVLESAFGRGDLGEQLNHEHEPLPEVTA